MTISAMNRVDFVCSCVPVVSTVKSLSDLWHKCFVLPFVSEKTLLDNWYYTSVKGKRWRRCALLLIPLIGNLIVYLEAQKSRRLYELAEEYNRSSHELSSVSRHLYERAAHLGHAEARFKLGGIEDIFAAAEKGHVGAMLEAGRLAESWKQTDKAERWYKRAAKERDVTAMLSLGRMHQEGKLESNQPCAKEAATWYERAVMGGNLEAAFRLRRLYQEGNIGREKESLSRRLDVMIQWTEKIATESL